MPLLLLHLLHLPFCTDNVLNNLVGSLQPMGKSLVKVYSLIMLFYLITGEQDCLWVLYCLLQGFGGDAGMCFPASSE